MQTNESILNTNKQTFTELRSTNWPKIVTAVVLGLGLLAAAYAGYWYRDQQVQLVEKPTAVFQPTSTPIPAHKPELKASWVNTSFFGYGLAFEYPEGWHVASYGPEGLTEGTLVLVNPEPIMVTTTHGPASEIIISVKNGFLNPEEEFNKMYQEEKARLENVFEEEIPSEHFVKIHHLKGTVAGGGMLGGTSVNKYFFISSNPKYTNLDDKLNRNLITISGEQSTTLEHIVESFKECSYTHCEAIFK